MRIPDAVHTEKLQFAYNLWKANPTYSGDEINAEVAKKYKHKLNSKALFSLKPKPSESPIPEAHPKKLIIEDKTAHAGATVEETKTQNGIPQPIVDAVDKLLVLMRKHRIESVDLNSSGMASIRALESRELDVSFGGRRAVDSPRTVN